ncbi:unnamed protein product [Pedinophyceae sp. YPF-701]|nr:unnamed protein product [Pedinophyceae sp. YPF-701]
MGRRTGDQLKTFSKLRPKCASRRRATEPVQPYREIPAVMAQQGWAGPAAYDTGPGAPTLLDLAARVPAVVEHLPARDVTNFSAACWDALVAVLRHRAGATLAIGPDGELVKGLDVRTALLADSSAAVDLDGFTIPASDLAKLRAAIRIAGITSMQKYADNGQAYARSLRQILEIMLRQCRPVRLLAVRVGAPLAPLQQGSRRTDEEVQRLTDVLREHAGRALAMTPLRATFSPGTAPDEVRSEVVAEVFPGTGMHVIRIKDFEDCKATARLLPQHSCLQELSLSGRRSAEAGQPLPLSRQGVCQMLANGLRSVPTLRVLQMRAMGINASHAQLLFPALAGMHHLKVLDLSDNPALGGDGDCLQLLLDALSDKSGLRELWLDDCGLRPGGVRAIAEMFMSMEQRSLAVLSMRGTSATTNNTAGEEGMTAIASLLRHHRGFDVLRMPNYDISPATFFSTSVGSLDFCDAVGTGKWPRKLHLELCRIGDYGALLLAPALTCDAHLTSLSLIDADIGDTGAAALAEGLARVQTLVALDLGHNHVRATGASTLGDLIRCSPSLEVLRFAFNKAGDAGAFAIATALTRSNKLRILDLSGNCIGDQGAGAIAIGVQNSTSLQELHLATTPRGDVSIGERGAMAIAKALRTTRSLRKLTLTNQRLGCQGVGQVFNALAENATLRSLDMQCVGIDDDRVYGVLFEALRRNKTLAQLNLSGNKAGKNGMLLVGAALLMDNATLQDITMGMHGATRKTIIRTAIKRSLFLSSVILGTRVGAIWLLVKTVKHLTGLAYRAGGALTRGQH